MIYRRILSKVLQGLIFSLILLTHLAQARTLKEIQFELEHSLRMDWATGQSNSTALLREWAQAIIQTPDWETQPETQSVIERMKVFQQEKLPFEKARVFVENGLFYELADAAMKVINRANSFQPELIRAIARGIRSTDTQGAKDVKNSDGLTELIENLANFLDFSKPESITPLMENTHRELHYALSVGLENSTLSNSQLPESEWTLANRRNRLDSVLATWIDKSASLPAEFRARFLDEWVVPLIYLSTRNSESATHVAYPRFVAIMISRGDVLNLDPFRLILGENFFRITSIGVADGVGNTYPDIALTENQKAYLDSLAALIQSNDLKSQELVLSALNRIPRTPLKYLVDRVGASFLRDRSMSILKNTSKTLNVQDILASWLQLSRYSIEFSASLMESDFNWIATNIAFLLAKATQIQSEAERKAASRELRICIALLASLAQHENLDPTANEIFQEELNILTRAKMHTDDLTAKQISEFILRALTHRPEVVFKSMTPALILEVDAILKAPKNEELRKQVSDWLQRHPETVLSNMRTQVHSEIVKEVALHLLTSVTAQSYANRCAKIFTAP